MVLISRARDASGLNKTAPAKALALKNRICGRVLTGNRSLTTFKEHRLTTQEFNSLILPKLAKEKEAIETFTTLLKQKYSINSIEVWDVYSEEERAQYISLRKALLNKRVALVTICIIGAISQEVYMNFLCWVNTR